MSPPKKVKVTAQSHCLLYSVYSGSVRVRSITSKENVWFYNSEAHIRWTQLDDVSCECIV